MAFDLKKNNLNDKAEAGYKFELLLPEVGEATGAFITVRGDYSPIVKAYGRKKFQEYQAKEAAARKRQKEVEPMDLEQAEDLAVESACVRVISIEGFEDGGKPIESTKENIEAILREHSWIREAVMQESQNLQNFL